MKAVEWSSQADDLSRDGEFERQLPVVQIHGDMRNRSAAEIWKWLTFIVRGINRFIKFFKCDNVNIVTAWRPLRQRWKTLEQGRKARKEGLDDSMHLDSHLHSEDDASVSSSKSKEKISPRQGKGWMKRLIIRGLNGKGPNKRGIEFDGEDRRTWLTRKRRRIGRVGWVKQQHKESREPGLRVFLRPEERYTSGGESSLERAKGSPDYTTTTPSHFVPFKTAYSQEDEVSPGEVPDSETERDNEASSQPADDETAIQLLPDELVDKVLGRLPLTSVLRFRSVCRRWQSRLSPEGWCTIFPQHFPPTWTACPALFTSGNGKRQCAFYDLSTRKWSCIYLDFLPDPACHLLAASGGLLCLCFSGMNSTLFICNPLTKSWRALPDFNHARRRAGSMIVHMLVHRETGAYKVILIGHPTCMTGGGPPAMTEVFDSETGSWTALANVPSAGCTLAPSVVLRNGVLYCLTEHPSGLLAFNLARKVWRRLEIKSHFRVLFLFEYHGHIQLVARMSARVTRLGIWRLKESFPRVWLKMAVMPAEYASYFLKSGKLQCFGHDNFVCFASPRRPQWLLFDLDKRLWTWGTNARGLDQDNYNRWFFYEPRLDIQA